MEGQSTCTEVDHRPPTSKIHVLARGSESTTNIMNVTSFIPKTDGCFEQRQDSSDKVYLASHITIMKYCTTED
ncbi:hypothetical protein FRX31_032172 [Thalictrum thalictroides]|uniref:Uncharacterized protein n=1 Tax=Thalictrum thalictroides TaxID=46969 RepID=A0A7J6V241_THATH|nr:hypothetical protein FRX31_032172 [Thalictrum thalictroides]